ncbi:MAG TPA: 50S ribosomal protein L32 [Patescibacteria group bacterium]|nr:50S ribosomal protein L32 [Patescibacteria group bacterium]
MTPLPKRRWSTRRQGKRRAAQVATRLSMNRCPNCGHLKQTHAACPSCGIYRGKQVVAVKTKPAAQ